MRWRLLFIACAMALCAGMIIVSCSNDDMVRPRDVGPIEGIEGARLFAWAIGPIDGITSAWHPTPSVVYVPVGTTLQLKCGAGAMGEITWVNAREVNRSADGSIAELRVARGAQEVSVTTASGDGEGDGGGGKGGDPAGSSTAHTCTIIGVDATAKDFAVTGLSVRARPMPLNEESDNFETWRTFSAGGERFQEISTLRTVGIDRYRTAVNRLIEFEASTKDARFASLIEVRLPGERPRLVTDFNSIISEVGTHTISVGPVSVPRKVSIETYSVSITSHVNGTVVPENKAVTFTAKTNPPGFEDEITWISSTKFGTARPVVGHGSTFTVTFRETWGFHDEIPGQLFQWLGVRADNAGYTLDQKPVYLKSITVANKGGLVNDDPSLIVVRIHCPKPAACVPIPAADAPGVSALNVVCVGSSPCEFNGGAGNALQVALNLAASFTGNGCPAAVLATVPPGPIGYQVVVSLPAGCWPDVVCSIEKIGTLENFGLGGCPLRLDNLNPVNDVCNGAAGDERGAWAAGYQFTSP